jgi:hypothetical protein
MKICMLKRQLQFMKKRKNTNLISLMIFIHLFNHKTKEIPMDLIQTSYTEEMHMKGSEEIARSNKIVK